MPCYHPLKAAKVGVNPETGKDVLKVFSFSIDKPYDYIIPCGQCVGCRLDHSREWADRIMLESLYHEHAYFITLTYDDAHLPKKASFVEADIEEDEYTFDFEDYTSKKYKILGDYKVPKEYQKLVFDVSTGEVINREHEFNVLNKRDVQLFLKRLRKNSGVQGIRYFYCGEYGPNTLRPHYHMILFGLELTDLVLHQRGEHPLYTSKFVEENWKNGYCPIGKLTWESAAYVARYCVGKSYSPLDYKRFEEYGLVKPFICMSRKPGLATQYYLDNKEKIFGDVRPIIPNCPGKPLYPPKRFMQMYDADEPDKAQSYKDKARAAAVMRIETELAQTTLDYEEYLKIKEEQHIKRAKKLIREDN